MAESRQEGRMPPHNLNAEKSVLGAMMLEPWAATHVARLTTEDFYYPANGQIFSCMQELFKAGRPIDFLTLNDLLEKRGVIESLGGIDYLIELSNFVPSAVNVEHYVDMVLERSLLRQLIKIATKLSDDCYEGSRETKAILQDAEKAIFTLSQRNVRRKDFIPIAQAVEEVYKRAELLMDNPDIENGLPTGFPTLDFKIGGMQPSQLILVAARPSMGKSAFAMNIAQHLATYRQKNIVLFSLEMPYEQLAQRVLSTGSKVPLTKIRSGRLEPEEWGKLADAVMEIGKTSILVDDSPGITIMEMLSKCRRLGLERHIDLIVIDYLQLITSTSDGRQRENRQQEISEMTRALKLMARELDVPVMLISQLSRAAEKRESHRPVLADLRESGAIEQDADIVMFIYRESYYKKYESGTEAEIIVAKNRNGAIGSVKVAWNENIVSFQNVDNHHAGEAY
jgi:replicative DNA helicase